MVGETHLDASMGLYIYTKTFPRGTYSLGNIRVNHVNRIYTLSNHPDVTSVWNGLAKNNNILLFLDQ